MTCTAAGPRRSDDRLGLPHSYHLFQQGQQETKLLIDCEFPPDFNISDIELSLAALPFLRLALPSAFVLQQQTQLQRRSAPPRIQTPLHRSIMQREGRATRQERRRALACSGRGFGGGAASEICCGLRPTSATFSCAGTATLPARDVGTEGTSSRLGCRASGPFPVRP